MTYDEFEGSELLSDNGHCTTLKCSRDDVLYVLKRFAEPTTDDRERIRRRADALTLLDHAGLASCYGIVEDEDSIALVYDWIEGETVMEQIDRGRRWTEPELFQFLSQTVDAISSAHASSVIHRDIKPHNIVFDGDRYVLIDFDAAREFFDTSGNVSVIGTTGYAGPEQFLGQADDRSDQYGIASTVVHMASHKHPTEFPLQELRLDISRLTMSEALRSILEKMLDPDPNKRFADGERAKEAIERGSVARPWEYALAPLSKLDSVIRAEQDGDTIVYHVSRRGNALAVLGPLVLFIATPVVIALFWPVKVVFVFSILVGLFLVGYYMPLVVDLFRSHHDVTLRLSNDSVDVTIKRFPFGSTTLSGGDDLIVREIPRDWIDNIRTQWHVRERGRLEIRLGGGTAKICAGMYPSEAERLKTSIKNAMEDLKTET